MGMKYILLLLLLLFIICLCRISKLYYI